MVLAGKDHPDVHPPGWGGPPAGADVRPQAQSGPVERQCALCWSTLRLTFGKRSWIIIRGGEMNFRTSTLCQPENFAPANPHCFPKSPRWPAKKHPRDFLSKSVFGDQQLEFRIPTKKTLWGSAFFFLRLASAREIVDDIPRARVPGMRGWKVPGE